MHCLGSPRTSLCAHTLVILLLVHFQEFFYKHARARMQWYFGQPQTARGSLHWLTAVPLQRAREQDSVGGPGFLAIPVISPSRPCIAYYFPCQWQFIFPLRRRISFLGGPLSESDIQCSPLNGSSVLLVLSKKNWTNRRAEPWTEQFY